MVSNVTTDRRFSARLLTYVVTAFVGLLLLAGSASANGTSSAIYQACIDGESLSGFSKSALQNALSGVPSDLDEYYDCSGQIKAALAGKHDKPGGGPTAQVKSAGGRYGGKSKYAGMTPAERKAAIAKDKRKSGAQETDAAIRRAATTPLATSAGAATPVWLIIGIGGLVVLLTLELLRRTKLADRLPGRRSSANPRDDA